MAPHINIVWSLFCPLHVHHVGVLEQELRAGMGESKESRERERERVCVCDLIYFHTMIIMLRLSFFDQRAFIT